MQGDEMMTRSATCAFFGGDRPIHYSTLYRGIAEGRYPKPVRVSPNSSRCLRSECQAARDKLVAERDGTAVPKAADGKADAPQAPRRQRATASVHRRGPRQPVDGRPVIAPEASASH
jgi:hypothetical protein